MKKATTPALISSIQKNMPSLGMLEDVEEEIRATPGYCTDCGRELIKRKGVYVCGDCGVEDTLTPKLEQITHNYII
jgi:hypothetical protein